MSMRELLLITKALVRIAEDAREMKRILKLDLVGRCRRQCRKQKTYSSAM